MITGLKPKGFTWIISDRLAVSERIGGNGFQHRRVRREEEINWLVREAKINTVVNLLAGNQNVGAYATAGIRTISVPMGSEVARDDPARLNEALGEALSDPHARVLVHKEIIDDELAGMLGGYLIASGLLNDRILAAAVIQEILGRPLGPAGRSLIPESAG
ncbi:MAG: hypothetical protein OEX04_14030 [Acidimicrobiia bacterium]|nr:hypothetical protein [Acidimicrobiia bacterium]MDH4308584.1 hypothetical protein [Acidimicrobiia bacterium]MDH5293151.1 hypothetical protein [Acidimicrobiia bacterium]